MHHMSSPSSVQGPRVRLPERGRGGITAARQAAYDGEVATFVERLHQIRSLDPISAPVLAVGVTSASSRGWSARASSRS
jgi:hypothetical protein